MPKKQPKERKQRRYEPIAVLAYLTAHEQRSPRRSPSERRIQQDLGIKTPSAVHLILRRLERAGLLTITRYGRGQLSDLVLTETGRSTAQRWQEQHDSTDGRTPIEKE
jgi:Mn-dependent DtxR family transcriptional regulator